MTELNIDFETASQCNLLTEGVYNYAMHPSTEILMMYWAFDDEEPVGWFPGDPMPVRIQHHINDGGRINAANAAFERLIWWYVMPKYDPLLRCPELEQFYCTLYKARCNNMPASLDKLARALGTFNQKAAADGKKLIKLFCILDENGYCEADIIEAAEDSEGKALNDFANAWDDLCDYCAQDVRAEREAGKLLREPTEEEWQDYFVNERINDRGVKIDRQLAAGAQTYAKVEEAELVGKIQLLTEGAVEKARGEKLKEWVMARLGEDQLRIMRKHTTKDGVKVVKYSLDKYIRQRLLGEDLDPVVAEVIECSDFAQKSSVSKFGAMLLRAHSQTNRVCGAFMANGASGTGRYSSKGLQVHNFTRNGMGDMQGEAIDDIADKIMPEDIRDYFKLPIMDILSRLLRAALVPQKGNVFLVADYAAIEGRVAPWLTKTRTGDAKVAMYANNEPVYEITAAGTFRCKVEAVTKGQRQIGKVQELAFQFGGGGNAYMAMARNYGLKTTGSEAEMYKDAWRELNPWAQEMWKRIESAAFNAVRSPGTQFVVGRLNYFAVENVLGYALTLFCELPCGRVLTYPDVKVGQKKAPWGDMVPSMSCMRSGWTPKQGEKAWPRGPLYGGLMFENAVQGTAASLLRDALWQCDDQGLPVVLHVHDEVVLEVFANADADHAAVKLRAIMNTAPEWADGLPLAAEVDEMLRYGK